MNGTLLDGFQVEGPPYMLSCGPDGRFIEVGWGNVTAPRAAGPYRVSGQIAVVDRRGQIERSFGTFPGPERYRYSRNDGPRPLGKTTIARIGRDAVYVGAADAYRIEIIPLGEGERRAFGRPRPTAPVTRDVIGRWEDSIFAGRSGPRRAEIRRSLANHVHPDFLPAYAGFRLDRAGRIWVEPYTLPLREMRRRDRRSGMFSVPKALSSHP